MSRGATTSFRLDGEAMRPDTRLGRPVSPGSRALGTPVRCAPLLGQRAGQERCALKYPVLSYGFDAYISDIGRTTMPLTVPVLRVLEACRGQRTSGPLCYDRFPASGLSISLPGGQDLEAWRRSCLEM